VRERGVSVGQVGARFRPASEPDAQLGEGLEADPQFAFPGKGQMKPEQLEIERLWREVQKLKAERKPRPNGTVGSMVLKMNDVADTLAVVQS
jgi:transposase